MMKIPYTSCTNKRSSRANRLTNSRVAHLVFHSTVCPRARGGTSYQVLNIHCEVQCFAEIERLLRCHQLRRHFEPQMTAWMLLNGPSGPAVEISDR